MGKYNWTNIKSCCKRSVGCDVFNGGCNQEVKRRVIFLIKFCFKRPGK
uniref:Uncharacterized protein n=1 Tax=Meloidogyne enterolobii TaxID=390850 RepID=A0A6V7WI79_MELEN|nr:unnamed protein product [Meloidogyne enterolobii]